MTQGKLEEAARCSAAEEAPRGSARTRCSMGNLGRRSNGHVASARAKRNLGSLLAKQGKLAEAEPLYARRREAAARCSGRDHPDHADLGEQPRDAAEGAGQACRRRSRCTARRSRAGRPSRAPAPVTLSSSTASAPAEEPGPRRGGGAAVARRSRAIREVLGPRHPDTLGSVGNLGLLLKQQGKLARRSRCTARRSRACAFMARHQLTLTFVNNLAACRRGQAGLDRRALRSAVRCSGLRERTRCATNNLDTCWRMGKLRRRSRCSARRSRASAR